MWASCQRGPVQGAVAVGVFMVVSAELCPLGVNAILVMEAVAGSEFN